MSVLSKALSVTLVTLTVAGCATTPDGYITGTKSNNDSDLQSGAQAEAQLQEPTSRQLLSRADDGIDINVETAASGSRVVISPNGLADYQISRMENPSRLIIDVDGYQVEDQKTVFVEEAHNLEKVRVGQNGDQGRIVLDLSGEDSLKTLAQAKVEQEDDSLVVSLGQAAPAALTTAALVPEVPVQEEIEVAPTPATIVAPAEEEVVALQEKSFQPEPEIEQAIPEQQELAAQPISAEPVLDTIAFGASGQNTGALTVGLSDTVPYDLRRSTPTEYVLTLPGVQASQRTLIPQLAPRDAKGLRSARAVQEGENSIVRMFVAPDHKLVAQPRGKQIVLIASKLSASQISALPASQTDARPQLAEESSTGAPASSEQTARVNPTGINSDDGTKLYTGRLISLDLQDTDIDNALRIIAEVSNLNIIASDDVTGKVTLRLIDVPWDQALDVILKTNGLDQVTEGNVIRIAPIDKLRQEREARREALQALENLEELKVSYYRISYARAGEVQEQVEGVLSERGTVTVDERTNQIIVKDIKKGQTEAFNLIQKLDLRTPQILLETQIVEGQRSILRDLGFQWSFNVRQGPEFGNATGLNFPNSVAVTGDDLLGGNAVSFPAAIADTGGSAINLLLDSADGSKSLGARLSAVEQEGRARVISRPQIATVNNKQAVIKSVETVRVRTPDAGTSVATGEGSSADGGGGSAFEEIEVGIELTVTPNASPDFYVLLDLDANSSTFGDREVDGIPSTVERTATSTILVQSGQTFALGGVYRIEDNDSVTGVPWLKDIPFFGAAFRSTSIDKGDEELIFFITPHIVEGSFDPSLL
jgi:type IV pilus assembly protein PilQ